MCSVYPLGAHPSVASSRHVGPQRSSACCRSAGYGELIASRSPVAGCSKRELARVQPLPRGGRAAWPAPDRRRRSGHRRTGWRIAAMCTRIWWVRPVSRWTSSSVAAAERLDRLVVGDARPAAGHDRELVVGRGCRSIGASMVPPVGSGWPCTSARVALVDGALLERPLEHRVGVLALGHDHHAGRAGVEAVHDALPFGRARGRDAVAHRGQPLHDRRPGPARARVRRHPDRLVDHHHVVVVVAARCQAGAPARRGSRRGRGGRAADLEPGAAVHLAERAGACPSMLTCRRRPGRPPRCARSRTAGPARRRAAARPARRAPAAAGAQLIGSAALGPSSVDADAGPSRRPGSRRRRSPSRPG